MPLDNGSPGSRNSTLETELRLASGQLRLLMDELLASEEDIGLQISICSRGKTIIDLSAGLADTETSRPVNADTLFPFFSVTKLLTASAVLISIAEGKLALDDRISDLWPEFGQFGKGDITLEQVLNHSAGIPQIPDNTDLSGFCDWDRMTSSVASLKPLWEPGTKIAYHAYTFGWILGEVLRRVYGTKEDFGTLVDRLIFRPARANRVWIGLPESEHDHVAVLYRDPAPPIPAEQLISRAIPDHLGVREDIYGRPAVRSAILPASGGIGNANSVARVCAILASFGTLEEQPVFATGPLKDIRNHMVEKLDLVTGRPQARALGFYVGGTTATQGAPFDIGSSSFGHPGAGGSVAWADPETGTGIAILRNRLTPQGWETPSVQKIVKFIRNNIISLAR